MYDRVLAAFPDALLEDPHDLRAITRCLEAHAERISYDALVHGPEDLATTARSSPSNARRQMPVA